MQVVIKKVFTRGIFEGMVFEEVMPFVSWERAVIWAKRVNSKKLEYHVPVIETHEFEFKCEAFK